MWTVSYWYSILLYKIIYRLDGQQVEIQVTEGGYHNAPLPESVITVKYDGFNKNGLLTYNHAYPVLLRVRGDVTWNHLKEQHEKAKKKGKYCKFFEISNKLKSNG